MKTGLILLDAFVFLSIVVIRALRNAPVIDDMDEN